MPSETFFCPHCRRQLQKSAAAFVLGEVGAFAVSGDAPRAVPCPGCGGPIDVEAMVAGRLDAPPGSWAAAIVLLVAFALGVGFFAWRRAEEAARRADPFRMRLWYAQDAEGNEFTQPLDALALYESAVRGLGDGDREDALARIAALEARAAREQPEAAHEDVLLSAARPGAVVRDRAGAEVGRLTLREEADGFVVDFALPGVEPADGGLLELRGHSALHGETVEHGAAARVVVLRTPYGPDPDLPAVGGATAQVVNGARLFELGVQGVPTAVSAPEVEAREGARALRLHVVLTR